MRNHGGVLLSTQSEEYLVVCSTSPSQNRLPGQAWQNTRFRA